MTYQDLLDAARRNSVGADYHALRMAYVRSDAYAPYADDRASVDALQNALHTGDLDAALDAIDTLLAHNYLDIEAHMAADYVYTRLENTAKAAYHRAFAKGLIDAIFGTGDGRRFESAFIVIRIAEEYTLLRIMRLVPDSQSLRQHQGHAYDVLQARDPASGQQHALYFNIDLPTGWLMRQRGNDQG
ncbi:MAG: DUF4919 domain-containing protein [Anaerolineae bacterium]|nr:DUF4919 domain-containing protein [Anaerolineae bacterium]